MRNFQKKRGLRNIIHSRPVLLFLSILMLFFAWGVVRFKGKMEETSRNREIVENKITELEKTKENLSSSIAKLKTNEGIEESIREKFGLSKEGEGVIIVVEDKNPGVAPKEESKGFFNFWKNLFH